LPKFVTPSHAIVLRKMDEPQCAEAVTEESEVRRSLLRALKGATSLGSSFWRRDLDEVWRHHHGVDRLVASIATEYLPRLMLVSGPVPAGSIAEVIRRHSSTSEIAAAGGK
jgi:hypothetical protein